MIKDFMRPFFGKRKILSIIIGLSLISSLIFFQKEVKSFFYTISSPIQKNLLNAGNKLSDFLADFAARKNTQRENRELKLKIEELLAENSFLQELKQENDFLRDALQIGLGKEFRLSLAEVIGKDIGQDSILINKGSRDGLSDGMPVITQQKILVGRISRVYDNFSRVLLITNKDSSFDAKLSGKDVSGVIKGRGGSEMLLDLVPTGKEVRQGDLVITASLGGIYPSGILAGLVKEIRKSDIEPFQRIEILPLFNVAQLGKVFLIINL